MSAARVSRLLAGCLLAVAAARADGLTDLSRWYVSPGIGVVVSDHDRPAIGAPMYTIRLKYDFNESLSFALGFLAAPYPGNHASNDAAVYFNRTGLYGAHGDVLIHRSRWERFDPYLILGVGYLRGGDRLMPERRRTAFSPRFGVGAMWHLNDHVSLRLDACVIGALNEKFDVYPAVDFGMVFRFGGTVGAGAKPIARGDTHGDGLSDADEPRLGTSPRDKDTDKDGGLTGGDVCGFLIAM